MYIKTCVYIMYLLVRNSFWNITYLPNLCVIYEFIWNLLSTHNLFSIESQMLVLIMFRREDVFCNKEMFVHTLVSLFLYLVLGDKPFLADMPWRACSTDFVCLVLNWTHLSHFFLLCYTGTLLVKVVSLLYQVFKICIFIYGMKTL